MKFLKMLAYIFLIIIIALLVTVIYMNTTKEESIKEKTETEVEFIEAKLVDLFNSLENLETQSYMTTINEVTSDTTEQKTSQTSEQSTEGDSSQSSAEGNQSELSSQESLGTEENTTMQLENNGILIKNDQIDWENIKKEVEIIYESLPIITLDLYQVYENENDIVQFLYEFDVLVVVVKEEDKIKVLEQLIKLYEYITRFNSAISEDSEYITLVRVKSEILKAYSLLDSNDWNQMEQNIKSGLNIYNEILNNIELVEKEEYKISKINIMINELLNSLKLQDKDVFLIKYVNLVEEINNM